MSYTLLRQILEHLEQYESLISEEERSIGSFLTFATQRQAQSDQNAPSHSDESFLNTMIARDISYLYRYMRYFVRKAIKDSPLQTIDEYSYLITLMAKGKMTKTELNNYNVVEKTTGVEIIRRLLKGGLISEHRNPHDRRSIDIAITPLGLQTLQQVLPYMQLSTNILLRSLSVDQKSLLHALHQGVCDSNEELFIEEKESDLLDIARLETIRMELPTIHPFMAPSPHGKK